MQSEMVAFSIEIFFFLPYYYIIDIDIKFQLIMSCNCKQKFDKIDEEYGEGPKIINKKSPFTKLAEIFAQIFFGVVCGVAIILVIIPVLLYIIFCLIIGKQVTFKIKNLDKYIKKS